MWKKDECSQERCVFSSEKGEKAYLEKLNPKIKRGWYLSCTDNADLDGLSEIVYDSVPLGDYLLPTEKIPLDLFNNLYFNTKKWEGTGMIVLTEAGPLEILKKV